MRDRVTDRAILAGYIRLTREIEQIKGIVTDIRQFLTSPVHLTHNEKQVLMSLPSHLIKTYFAVEALGECEASQVAAKTCKARACESGYLNQLVTMGYLEKKHQGVHIVFWVSRKVEAS